MDTIKEIFDPVIATIVGLFLMVVLLYTSPVLIYTKLVEGKLPEKVGTKNLLKSFIFSTIVWMFLAFLVRSSYHSISF